MCFSNSYVVQYCCVFMQKNDDSYFDKSIRSSMQHLDAIIYMGITRSQD